MIQSAQHKYNNVDAGEEDELFQYPKNSIIKINYNIDDDKFILENRRFLLDKLETNFSLISNYFCILFLNFQL